MRRTNQIMRNLRSLLTRARKGRNIPVPVLWSRFPKKSVTRSIATYARRMGACTRLTVPVNVVSMKKMEQKNQVSVPLRKAERRSIP
jgi:hypothetical protein